MKIKLNRKNDAFHFEAVNEDNIKIDIDAQPAIGGENKGFRPMQLLLAGLGGCSVFDIIVILQKQKQDLKDIDVIVEGNRLEKVPKSFSSINLHFILKGALDEKKVARAIELSVDKYCSVNASLSSTINVSHTFEIIN